MRLNNPALIRLLAILLALPALSCGDDSPGTGDDMWEEVTVVGAPAEGDIFSLAFSGTRGLAAGSENVTHGDVVVPTAFLATRLGDGTWSRVTDVPFPADSRLLAVGLTASGEAVVAGINLDTQSGFIMDERGGWSRHDRLFGGLAFARGADLRFAGSGSGSLSIMKSSAPDEWTPESIPFPAPDNEKGLTDVSATGGTFVACGFDDGGDGTPAEPNSVVFRNSGGSWVRLDAPCGGCSNREFKAVAARSGGFLLGGAVTDFSAGSPDHYEAFLIGYSETGGWFEIVLPGAATYDRVNDILIAANNDVYLACGVDGTFLVRLPAGGGVEREATLKAARLNALAESPDGSIWVAGTVTRGSVTSPILLQRRPG